MANWLIEQVEPTGNFVIVPSSENDVDTFTFNEAKDTIIMILEEKISAIRDMKEETYLKEYGEE